jgi:hypothetical protein
MIAKEMRLRCTASVLAWLLAAASAFAADISGIWVGQQEGRNGQKDDIAFRLKSEGGALTGKMLGDEFDLAIQDGSVTGDQIRFTITTTNFYSGRKATDVYSGVWKGGEIELTRERVQTPEEKTANRPPSKQILRLKKLA